MKETLINIYNALRNVETKGESTLIIADCLRALLDVIRELDKPDAVTSSDISSDVEN